MTFSKVQDTHQKTEEESKLPSSRLPNSKDKLDGMRAKQSQSRSNSPEAEKLTRTPEELMKLYLTGKIAMDQLAFELRKYNNVIAEMVIKQGKETHSQVIDYRGVAQPDMANPGAAINPEDSKKGPTPHSVSEAKKAARETNDPEKKKELERKEQELKRIEVQKQVVLFNIQKNIQEEQEKVQEQAARHIREEEKLEQDDVVEELDEETGEVTTASKRKNLKDQMRRSLSQEKKQNTPAPRMAPKGESR